MTSHYKTGTHPFYIGMYIHIYTHIYVHMFTYFFMGGRLTLTPEGYIPSRETITYPSLGKLGKSSTQICQTSGGYVI